jgi:hypothetical protein
MSYIASLESSSLAIYPRFRYTILGCEVSFLDQLLVAIRRILSKMKKKTECIARLEIAKEAEWARNLKEIAKELDRPRVAASARESYIQSL